MTTDEIEGHTLEYIDCSHTYLVDGVIVPSITQILKIKFGGKYSNVNKTVLKRAADKGTEVHRAIQDYCEKGTESDLKEVRNFKFLQKSYGFEVLQNEVPVILFRDDAPIAAGRLDLVLEIDGKIGGGDIKRTSTFDKEYTAMQLNLYRIAYRQCYGIEWQFLKGVHLRENVRKFFDLPINEKLAFDVVKKYFEAVNQDHSEKYGRCYTSYV